MKKDGWMEISVQMNMDICIKAGMVKNIMAMIISSITAEY